MTERLVSYSLRADGLDPALVRKHARGSERIFWESADGITFVGFGIAAEISAWGAERFKTIRRKAIDLFTNVVIAGDDTPLAQPRLFGGFSFSSEFITENVWAQFAPAYFVLPHYQFVAKDGEAWLTINIQIASGELFETEPLQAALEAQLERLRQPILEHDDPPHLTDINYPMSFEAWSRIITDATDRMKHDDLSKVVLSRVCELRFDQSVDIDHALDYLHDNYTGCYRFLFEPIPGLGFFGASPELLINVQDSTARTMALAGSIKRGDTPEADAQLADQLLNDPKERSEHGIVVDSLRERLHPLAESLDAPHTPVTLKLANIQHLYTPFSVNLKDEIGVLPLVERLHPTPALGGQPSELALDYIQHAEPVPRGWYAAPIGWIDHRLDGAFAVAIRSAVAQNERVWLYAGAGIVAESIPQKEWDETALKFKPILNALGVDLAETAHA